MNSLLRHVALEELPAPADLFSRAALEQHLAALGEPPLSLIAVGDIMLGGRARKAIAAYGADYPFAAVLPLLRRAPLILGNLEGPFARKARREQRNHSYRVAPARASALARAGINVVTLANNHLLDCGRAGVLETLDALSLAGVAPLGAAVNKKAAHAPVIKRAGRWRIGLLGYYWNRRCAATGSLPGSAMDPPAALRADIGGLRELVDWVVVTFHWGVPYEREPSSADREKARFAIDCGAHAVIGHHPHVVQPFEIYRGCPIFYSIGNFTFGSGNSRAEGILLGLRFGDERTTVEVYPLYLKNRDPRVDYQPKVLRGDAAGRLLRQLAAISGPDGSGLQIDGGRGQLDLPAPAPRGGRERGEDG